MGIDFSIPFWKSVLDLNIDPNDLEYLEEPNTYKQYTNLYAVLQLKYK